MLQGFDYDDMIYFSRYSLLGSATPCADMARDVFRFVIGIVGSLVVLLALHLAIQTGMLRGNVLGYLKAVGSMTFGIYVFQDLLLLVLNPMSRLLNEDYWILYSTIAFWILLWFSVKCTIISEKNPIVSKLFLGKNKK